MVEPDSPFERLLEGVRAALHADRQDVHERVARIEQTLLSYRRAAEHQVALEFARDHGLKLPAAPAGPGLFQAAQALRALVLALPELSVPEASPPITEAKLPEPKSKAAVLPPAYENPKLGQALAEAKLVILGRRPKPVDVPAEISERTEWIDTERQGAHAIGNLPQRVRQGRVAALIIVDRAVQHKHTEPVLAAAREMRIPIAFAGKGGRASLIRALSQIERVLEQQTV